MERTSPLAGAPVNPGSNATAEGQPDPDRDQSPAERTPDELLEVIFLFLDPKSLMIAVPQVCKHWRRVCHGLKGVNLDFDWWVEGTGNGTAKAPLCDRCTRYSLPVGGKVEVATKLCKDCLEDKLLCDTCCADSHEMMPYHTPSPIEERPTSAPADAFAGCCGYSPVNVPAGGGSAGTPMSCRTLVRSSSRIEDSHLFQLALYCPDLTRLDFGDCEGLTDFAVCFLAARCTFLTHVDFSFERVHVDMEMLTDRALVVLATCCPKLVHVDFGFFDNLTDAAVIVLAQNCPDLVYVRFLNGNSRGWGLTDTSTVELAKKCPGMKTVEFGGGQHISDSSLMVAIDRWDLDGDFPWGFVGYVTDRALLAYADRHPELTHLNLNPIDAYDTVTNTDADRELTDEGFMAFVDKCPRLKTVTCAYQDNLTEDSMLALVSRCLDLEMASFLQTGVTDAAKARVRQLYPKLELH